MMRTPPVMLLALALALAWSHGSGARAQATDDADRIPDTVLSGSVSKTNGSTASPNYTLYIENALTISNWRHASFLPIPFTAAPAWENRTDADIRGTVDLLPDLSFSYSDRLNLFIRQKSALEPAFAFDRDVQNDLREAYFTWHAGPSFFFDVGRINQRNGVAYAFNPTDFLRTNSAIATDSQDPRSIRENRLGVFMLRAQAGWSFASATLIYAPRLDKENPVIGDVPVNGFRPDDGLDPRLGRTNHSNRFMLNATFDAVPDVSSQVTLFHGEGQTAAGANFTYGLGNSAVVYAEWSGRDRYGVGEEAIDDCIDVGLCPAIVRSLGLFPSTKAFRNDAALGLSYTFPNELTANLEYDYHQSGFDRSEFKHWYSDAVLVGEFGGSLLRDELLDAIWLPRQYSQLKAEEPLSRQSLFGRAQWSDAFVKNLTLAGMMDFDLYDGSAFAELSVQYDSDDAWRLGLFGDIFTGSRISEFGTTPQCARILLSVARYF